MKVLALIVLYNPDMNRLNQNIEAVSLQVDEVVLVDNGSDNIDEVKNNIKNSVTFIYNDKNVGIARALNEGFEYAIKNEYDWVLTLDQDSVTEKHLVEIYKKYLHLPDIGMLTCNFVDRNSDIILEEEQQKEYYTVSRCITSASFCSVEAYIKSGGFDDYMFIDYVDHDYSAKMYKNNYKIYRINYDGLLHEIGHTKVYHFLGLRAVSTNHSAFRQYYMARNNIILAKKYPEYYKMTNRIVVELCRWIVIILFEKNKMKKLSRRFKGIKDGVKYKTSDN